MRIRNEQGIALVLSLLLMMVLSAIAVSLMFLSQTETYSSLNYRLMSQTRYGAESGIQKTVNYLLNNYAAPTTGGADPLANYDMNVSPVTYNGQPVVLSGNGEVASNYPVAAVQDAFSAAVQGTLPAGTTTVTYAPSATLLSMQQVNSYGGGPTTIQTWEITSNGSIAVLGRTAQVEVTAVLETQKAAAQMYAAFATNGDCGALNFRGNNTTTDSYDSSAALVGGSPVIASFGGNLGTNGNLSEGGGATINGSLSTPRIGVGGCSDGNVTPLTSSGGATVAGGVIQLPAAVSMAAPTVPTGVPTTSYNGNGQVLLDGASVGNVTVNAGAVLTLCMPGSTCTIKINSILLNGNSTLLIAPGATVILNVVGQSQTTPIDFTGGAVINASFDPSHFQIQYAGTGDVRLNGGSETAAMVYAPNAAVSFSGNGDFYGSVVGATVKDTGGAQIHYDRNLSESFYTVGNPMMTSFSWKKY